MQSECCTRAHFWTAFGKREVTSFFQQEGCELSFCWKKGELSFCLEERTKEPFLLSWPKYQNGDSCLLYLDTRPKLHARSMRRECHEFLILPEAVEGVQTKEITRFHGYETRPLLPPNTVSVSIESGKSRRRYEIHVPLEKLWGYDDEAECYSFAFGYFSKAQSRPLYLPIPTIIPEKVPHMWPVIHKEPVR